MARSQVDDFYHAFKFRVKVTTPGITGAPGIDGGFATAVMPEQSLESAEYKEGTYLRRRKQPGDVTYSDLTLTKGVVKKGTSFWDWINATTKGQEYRVDLTIFHFHRDEIVNEEDLSNKDAKRQIICHECFPIRVKPGSDFDGQSSDISIQEIDIAMEWFEVVDK